jgi:CTP synthase
MSDWQVMLDTIKHPKQGELQIAVVGKYVKHSDAYKSVYEAIHHAGIANQVRAIVKRISAEHVERESVEKLMQNCDGLLIPGGFDVRGIQGKLDAIRYARENKIPFLGLCLGLQCAAIEFARNSMEFSKTTAHPIVCMLDDLKLVTNLGGTMRKGAYHCRLQPGSKAFEAYGKELISERHRHRYEVNNEYRGMLTQHGLFISGTSVDNMLVEVIELRDHPWFVGTQAHPEFKSKPNAAHPLFRDFIAASLRHRNERKSAKS